jgi:hypothetical protein
MLKAIQGGGAAMQSKALHRSEATLHLERRLLQSLQGSAT